MDKGWPSVRKSCKTRARPVSQRDETPILNLDAVKLNLQSPVLKCKLKKEAVDSNVSKDGGAVKELDDNREDEARQFDSRKETPVIEQKLGSSLDFTNILELSFISSNDEAKEHQSKMNNYSRNNVNDDHLRTGIKQRIRSQGRIGPRKIFLGGGFYNAIAIYDRNSKIDIVKVGETRLGCMDYVINRKEINAEKNRNHCLPRVRNTLGIDGLRYMPQELKCGKISDAIPRAKTSAKSNSTCRLCEQTKTKTCRNISSKQIKLFVSIDV